MRLIEFVLRMGEFIKFSFLRKRPFAVQSILVLLSSFASASASADPLLLNYYKGGVLDASYLKPGLLNSAELAKKYLEYRDSLNAEVKDLVGEQLKKDKVTLKEVLSDENRLKEFKNKIAKSLEEKRDASTLIPLKDLLARFFDGLNVSDSPTLLSYDLDIALSADASLALGVNTRRKGLVSDLAKGVVARQGNVANSESLDGSFAVSSLAALNSSSQFNDSLARSLSMSSQAAGNSSGDLVSFAASVIGGSSNTDSSGQDHKSGGTLGKEVYLDESKIVQSENGAVTTVATNEQGYDQSPATSDSSLWSSGSGSTSSSPATTYAATSEASAPAASTSEDQALSQHTGEITPPVSDETNHEVPAPTPAAASSAQQSPSSSSTNQASNSAAQTSPNLREPASMNSTPQVNPPTIAQNSVSFVNDMNSSNDGTSQHADSSNNQAKIAESASSLASIAAAGVSSPLGMSLMAKHLSNTSPSIASDNASTNESVSKLPLKEKKIKEFGEQKEVPKIYSILEAMVKGDKNNLTSSDDPYCKKEFAQKHNNFETAYARVQLLEDKMNSEMVCEAGSRACSKKIWAKADILNTIMNAMDKPFCFLVGRQAQLIPWNSYLAQDDSGKVRFHKGVKLNYNPELIFEEAKDHASQEDIKKAHEELLNNNCRSLFVSDQDSLSPEQLRNGNSLSTRLINSVVNEIALEIGKDGVSEDTKGFNNRFQTKIVGLRGSSSSLGAISKKSGHVNPLINSIISCNQKGTQLGGFVAAAEHALEPLAEACGVLATDKDKNNASPDWYAHKQIIDAEKILRESFNDRPRLRSLASQLILAGGNSEGAATCDEIGARYLTYRALNSIKTSPSRFDEKGVPDMPMMHYAYGKDNKIDKGMGDSKNTLVHKQ